jgi:hypothetical protein
MSNEGERRRLFIAKSARDFLRASFPNILEGMAASAVQSAIHLADELEKADCAPWTRTIDVNDFTKSSYPVLEAHGEEERD